MKAPRLGDIVIYVEHSHWSKAGIVSQIRGPGQVDLHVFEPHSLVVDCGVPLPIVKCVWGINYDGAEKRPFTWHYPEDGDVSETKAPAPTPAPPRATAAAAPAPAPPAPPKPTPPAAPRPAAPAPIAPKDKPRQGLGASRKK